MAGSEFMPNEFEQRYRRLGGFLLLFLVGCLAYVVLFPISMVLGAAPVIRP